MFSHRLHNLFQRGPRTRRPFHARPLLEALESRRVPATLTWEGDLSAAWGASTLEEIQGPNGPQFIYNTNWHDEQNNQTLPQDGDSLVFPDLPSDRIHNTNNTFTNLAVQAITFDGGDYIHSGNAVTLLTAGSIHNNVGTNTINLGIALTDPDTLISVTSDPGLVLNGVLSGTGSFVKDGGGPLSLTGSEANTFSGSTVLVRDGWLNLSKAGALAIPTGVAVVVGDGVGDPLSARVVIDLSEGIGDTSDVAVARDGLLTLLADAHIGGLVVSGGHVFLGDEDFSATLSVRDLEMNGGSVLFLSAVPSTLQLRGGASFGPDGTGNAPVITKLPSDVVNILDLAGQTQVFQVANGPAVVDLTINATIANGGLTLSTQSGAVTRFEGTAANTYTGATILQGGGRLVLAKQGEGTVAIPGPLVIGTAAGAPDTDVVELAAADQIADTAAVTINASGLLSLGSGATAYPDTVGSLTMVGGHVAGPGTLTVGGTISATSDNAGRPALIDAPLQALLANPIRLDVLDGPGARDAVYSQAEDHGAENTILKGGPGTLALTSVQNGFEPDLVVNAGTVQLLQQDPEQPGVGTLTLNAGTTLAGNGWYNVVSHGGTVSPGIAGPGLLLAKDQFHLDAATTVRLDLNGSTPFLNPQGKYNPDGQFDQLAFYGPGQFALGNALLVVHPGYAVPLGTVFVIVDNLNSQQSSPLGSFSGLSEGCVFQTEGQYFQITYKGGDGNDVALTRVSRFQTYVEQLYHDILGRPSDRSGLANFVGLLEAGVSPTVVANSFLTSYERRGLTVDELYRQMLGRAADPQGRAYHVDQLMQGVSEAETLSRFVLSQEYLARHGTAQAFVEGLYNDVLYRAGHISAAEMAPYVDLLQAGRVRRLDLVYAFLGSEELHNMAVQDNYQALLGRDPAAAELAAWQPYMHSPNVNPTDLAVAFLTSPEYFDRAARCAAPEPSVPAPRY